MGIGTLPLIVFRVSLPCVAALLADDSDATVATLRSTGASELVSRLHERHCAHETLPMSVAGFVSNCVMSFTGHWDVAELAELFAVRREEQEWFLRNGFLALILKVDTRDTNTGDCKSRTSYKDVGLSCDCRC